jgi:hypothetical protein
MHYESIKEVKMTKWDKLTAFLSNKGNSVHLPVVQLTKIVGPLKPQTYKRISYWDPFMGKARLNPGSAAKKAGFVVTGFEWHKTGAHPVLTGIRLERI